MWALLLAVIGCGDASQAGDETTFTVGPHLRLNAITVDTESGRLRLARGPSGWSIVEPTAFRADDARTSRLEAMFRLELASVARREERLSGAALGVTGPSALAVSVTPSDAQPFSITVGHAAHIDGQPVTWVRPTGSVFVYALPGDLRRNLPSDERAWRSHRLWWRSSDEVDGIGAGAVGAHVAARRVAGRWRSLPMSVAVDETRVNRLLRSLETAEAVSTIGAATPEELGDADRPHEVVAVLWLLAVNEMTRFEVGARRPDGTHVVAVNGVPRYVVDHEVARLIIEAALTLTPPMRLDVSPERVARLEAMVDERWTSWFDSSATRDRAESVALESRPDRRVQAVARLRADRRAPESSAQEALSRPTRELRITLDDGVVHHLVLANDTGTTYARLDAGLPFILERGAATILLASTP